MSCHKAHYILPLAYSNTIQAHVWVASFPAHAVLLVDAVVWTQSVSSALARTAAGDRPALRNALDASVLRLETLGRQLRTAMALVAGLNERLATVRQQGLGGEWEGEAGVWS